MANRLRATWGVTSGRAVGGYGVVVGIEIGSEGLFITETDVRGAVDGVFLYDVKIVNACDILIKAGTTPPGIGDRISIGNTPGYITDVRIVELNTAYQKMHISVSAHEKTDTATIATK